MRIARLLALALLALPAAAQESESPAEPGPGPEPEPVAPEPKPITEVRHEIRLRSGSVLVGNLEPVEWSVQTAFGVLRVPVNEIKNVRFGRRSDEERLAYVQKLIEDLASSNPDRRARARADLKQEGPFAVLDLKRTAKKHEDPEVKRVCSELVDELDLEDEEIIPDEDTIETTRFSLSGTVGPTAFKVTVSELGAVNVRRRDIVRIRAYEPDRLHKFTVSSQYSTQQTWLDTKVRVEPGQILRIQAEGSIHFPNWGNQVFGPEGNVRMGQVNSMPIGSLAGRIGEKGTIFRIGRQYKAKAKQKGRLYLALVLHRNMAGQPNTGEYTVRIQRLDE